MGGLSGVSLLITKTSHNAPSYTLRTLALAALVCSARCVHDVLSVYYNLRHLLRSRLPAPQNSLDGFYIGGGYS